MHLNSISKRTIFSIMITAGLLLVGQSRAARYIVENGEAMAEIVVPETPTNSVKLAAQELQHYIQQISGATLPIFPPNAMEDAEPQGTHLLAKYPLELERKPIKIYVGESWHTDQLGVTDDGLDWGAYRIKSGNGWLALVGKDTDFVPMGIWGRNRGRMQQAQEEWDQVIGDHHWENPMAKLWIRHNRERDMWAFDETGSLNAVYGYLRRLGVRWYMPGELGEIVPQMASIELPEVDETVIPDVKIRDFIWAKYGLRSAEEVMVWSMRIGANNGFGYRGAHGQAHVTRPEENRRNHPEWYALYNGKRDIDSRTPNPCLSSEGLFEEQVRYIRFVFDMYDVPAVCVAPDDGFTAICQCELCEGKNTPERGRNGALSDYVWEYTNRIAKELYKTHPDKLILGCVYSTYWLPPTTIDKFSPNVAVHLVNARRRYNIPKDELQARRAAVEEWARLTDNKIITFMNDGGGRLTPRIFAEDIKAMKGLIMGEEMHGPYERGTLAIPAFTHLPYYVASRLWWDMDLDVDALLDEYYQDFYGPAAAEMAAFTDYYERHQRDMRGINGAPAIERALELFAAAEQKVDPESVYGQRIALFSRGLDGARKWYETIKDGRPNPPVFELTRIDGEITVDGKLEEAAWQTLPGEFREIQDGGVPEHPSRFQIGLKDNHLYIAISCQDTPGNPVNIAKVDKHDDGALWYGDVVEILLETPDHSYYQIAINPDGMVADLDRSTRIDFAWSSLADVATQVNEQEGTWTIEARIPFTPSAQDPLHEIIGPTPSDAQPWFFNICRQRIRDEGNQMTAFSPTGKKNFHNILTFGKLVPQ